ncbi:MAG TPA: HAD family phosphatase [Gemmatimonadaceae bacterium]
MLDTVLFELEGVLADTAAARRETLLEAVAREGIHLSDAEYQEVCAGLGTEDAVRAAFRTRSAAVDDTTISLAALAAERAYRARLAKGVTLVAGAREVVERLHRTSRLGLVTRSPRAEAQFVLALANLEHCFGCVVAAEDVRAPKPAPDGYVVALKRLRHGRETWRAVALEDGLPGIRAARAAGITCVVVGDVPAHVALEADAGIPELARLTPDQLQALAARRSEPIG